MTGKTCAEWLERAKECHIALEELVGSASFAGNDDARQGALPVAISDATDFVAALLQLAASDTWAPARALLRGLRERTGWVWAIHEDSKFAREATLESQRWEAGGQPPRAGFARAERIWMKHLETIGVLQPDASREKLAEELYRSQASADHPTLFSAQQALHAAIHPESSVAIYFGSEVAVFTAMLTSAVAQIAIERGNTGELARHALELSAQVQSEFRQA